MVAMSQVQRHNKADQEDLMRPLAQSRAARLELHKLVFVLVQLFSLAKEMQSICPQLVTPSCRSVRFRTVVRSQPHYPHRSVRFAVQLHMHTLPACQEQALVLLLVRLQLETLTQLSSQSRLGAGPTKLPRSKPVL